MESKASSIFICDFHNCEKIFNTKYSMMRHINTHKKKKNYKWKECDKQFSFKQNLVEHEFIHSGELPYLWGVNGCQLRFRQRGKLSLHRQSHNNYQKKEYRTHSAVNGEDASKPENQPSMPHPVACAHVPAMNIVLNAVNNNGMSLNQFALKLNQIESQVKRYVIVGQAMPNGVYQINSNIVTPQSLFKSIPYAYSVPRPNVLPKLSVVLMGNKLNCLLN